MLRRTLLLVLLSASPASFAQGPPAAPAGAAPPQVIVSYPPAVLVHIDGKAQMVPVTGHPRVQLVRNTKALILLAERPYTQYLGDFQHDVSYYLRLRDGWMMASWLVGPWKPATMLPLLRRQLDAIATELGKQDGFVAVDWSMTPAPPQVFVVESPAELVLFDGPPRAIVVDGTHLRRVANASRELWVDPVSRTYYLRADERWLAAPALDGPWAFVAAGTLPAVVATPAPRR